MWWEAELWKIGKEGEGKGTDWLQMSCKGFLHVNYDWSKIGGINGKSFDTVGKCSVGENDEDV